MTHRNDIINDPKYIPILDHGFVGLVDHMGTDNAIVQAARVSYGQGTKQVNEDRGLIRYLMRHKHTSPFEMCQIKLHIKIPIFIMRQLVRHRTASLNEYSGRYSVMVDEFYVPLPENIKPQSTTNKQGRAGDINETNIKGVQWLINTNNSNCYETYKILLGEGKDQKELLYDPYNANEHTDALLEKDFPGISRELARMVLGVNNYTELYWTQNLHNMFHLLKLRMDSHAQYEIQVLAQAIYEHVSKLFPVATEAWEDYVNKSITFSRMEKLVLKELLGDSAAAKMTQLEATSTPKEVAESFGMSLREWNEFKNTLTNLG